MQLSRPLPIAVVLLLDVPSSLLHAVQIRSLQCTPHKSGQSDVMHEVDKIAQNLQSAHVHHDHPLLKNIIHETYRVGAGNMRHGSATNGLEKMHKPSS